MGLASPHWFLGLVASSAGWPEGQEHPEEWARPSAPGSLGTWGAVGEESRCRCCSSLAKGARAQRPWGSKRHRLGAVAVEVVVVEEGLEAPVPPVQGCWALCSVLGTHRVGGEGVGAGWVAGAVGLIGASLLCH